MAAMPLDLLGALVGGLDMMNSPLRRLFDDESDMAKASLNGRRAATPALGEVRPRRSPAMLCFITSDSPKR